MRKLLAVGGGNLCWKGTATKTYETDGWENRRTRRETARELAKKIMRDGGNLYKARKRERMAVTCPITDWYLALYGADCAEPRTGVE
jgi:hypothetical protein